MWYIIHILNGIVIYMFKSFIKSVSSYNFVFEVVEYAIQLSQEVYCGTRGDCLNEAFDDLINFELDCLLYDI